MPLTTFSELQQNFHQSLRICNLSLYFRNWKKSSVFKLTKFHSLRNILFWGENDFQCRTIREEILQGIMYELGSGTEQKFKIKSLVT